ncbi:hypothetical protein ACOSQ3_030978 [Xanthoceras sorbifolium]
MNFPPGTFRQIQGGTTNGFLIDSGAPNTMIDQRTNRVNAYQMLMTVLQKHYDSFGLQKRALPLKGPSYQLCYSDKPGFNQHPTMTFRAFCVAILPGNRISILGANHQQNMRVIYDGNFQELHFYTENCIDDQNP